MSGRIIIFDTLLGCWLEFRNPQLVVQTNQIDQVIPALRQVEHLVETHSWHAAGFISYEAGPAFDRALVTHPPGKFPLLWFGLYEKSHCSQAGLPAAPFSSRTEITWIPSIDLPNYVEAINTIKHHIARGDTYQVNYTIRLHAQASFRPWELFLRLNQAQQSSFGAYLDTGAYIICCASPELFFLLDGNEITTRPMKGTARRGLTNTQDQDQARWLFNSVKNRAENVMIVDMLRNDLGKVARTGSVHVSRLFELERYPTVWQMTSTVQAETSSTVSEIFQALFPCGSITGAPKARTMQIIRALESEPRNVYTGAIGFISPHRKAQFNVAIRTVLVDVQRGSAAYGVGGGIVWDSTPDEEYGECQIKAGVLSRQPVVFSLLETILWESGSGYFLLDYHLKRLSDSASYFGYPFDADEVDKALHSLAERTQAKKLRVRLLLNAVGLVECQASVFEADDTSKVVQLRLAATPVSTQEIFLYHKTTRRALYDAARQSAPNADDVLLWNEHSEVTETTVANLVYEMGGKLHTPPIECGALPGVYRQWLLEQGVISERRLKLCELDQLSKLYVVNSVRKMRLAALDPDDLARVVSDQD